MDTVQVDNRTVVERRELFEFHLVRVAEWVAVFCDGRKDQHPLTKSDTRLSPG